MGNKFDIQKFKEKMGLQTFLNPPEDYRSIIPEAWYYVIGDGGMKGKDVIEKHIAMHRVITWAEHKAQQKRSQEIIDNEKRKREESYDEIPF